MNKIIVSAMAALLLCGPAIAQQTNIPAAKTETVKTAKHKKKTHRENGTADAQRQAAPVMHSANATPANTPQTKPTAATY